ncbi:helix-turn-helix transcriptional regulator [Pontiella sulfatireligans]|uniref:HTH-type transcriptional activator Btr n=1 Tax=Pontiella sulfatireligans TaxID=2750658 RepID=A0A6C2UG12_9BACT|nr:AraC family transcriptional regulator [Pontiella sulfatireligans]VGO19058.1 HTH-type transcriptional activator Btr [Pontiella sulfatireligans]
MKSLLFLHGAHVPHCHATVDKALDYYSLQLMLGGGVELFYDNDRYELNSPSIWPGFPGPRMRFHPRASSDSWDHRYIAFTGPLSMQWAAEGIIPRLPVTLEQKDAQWLAHRFDQLFVELERPGRWGQAWAVHHLEAIMLYLGERTVTAGKQDPPWLESVMEELGALNNKIDYAVLALKYHMSMATLRRHFRSETGVSPHQYRLECRIAEARRLLVETELRIQEIADKLGYQDVYYFSRQFSSFVGVSPMCYRKSRQI